MNNYQLYRTNLLLGGQMKMDLILNSSYNTLYVADFHLTPISSNASYTYKNDEQLINNSHQDNIKMFYAQNKGIFYKECLNQEFTNNWPNICNENDIIPTYSNMYDMGCKRSKYYNQYYKQFEFFCPIWLENIGENDILKFKIDVKNINSNTILGSNTLSFDLIENEYHNKFINYFNEYISKANLNDDLININFDTNYATITGLNVNTGLFETKPINNLVQNITYRERPLMETDNMIISYYQDNTMICKQLFNFNLCFNLEDIFSSHIVKMLYGENVKISVSVFIGDTQLEIKDFYTEYDYIPRKIYGDESDYSANVLDYLKDNKYIKFIDKNKFCQSICHWSLCDNNDYIFNLYNGFSGLCIDDNNIYENDHVYGNTPNTYLSKYDKIANNIGWINMYNVNIWEDFYKYIRYTDKYKLQGTHIIQDKNYINNIKYNYIPVLNDIKDIYIIGLVINNNLFPDIIQSFKPIKLFNTSIYILIIDNLIILLTNDANNFTFAKFYNYIKTYKNKNNFNDITDVLYKNTLDELYKFLISRIEPKIVYLSNSLMYTQSDSPIKHININEIDYIKEDNVYNYVIRYDGKIKPTFTDNVSTLYYKDYVSIENIKNSIYSKYAVLNYEPIYPSIDYCPIKKLNEWNRTIYPKVKVSEHDNNVDILGNNFEYKWFNESHCLILNNEINFIYTKLVSQNDNKTIDNIIEEKLKNYYNIEDNKKLQFIKNMYNYTINWEYHNSTNIQDYVYNITLKLNYDKNK